MRARPRLRRTLATMLLLLLAIAARPAPLASQTDETGDGGGLIGLTLPMGARVVASGRAAVSMEAELQALPYNPAAVVGLDPGAVTFSRFEAAEGTGLSSNYLAGAWTSPWGTLAAHAVLHDFGEIPVTDDSPDPVGSIDVSERVVGVTYANRWRERLAWGATVKIYTSDLGEADGTTPAFDAGLLWSPREGLPLDIGVSVRNLGPDLEYGATSTSGGDESEHAERLPSRFRVGIALRPEAFGALPEAYRVTLYADTESDLEELSTTDLHAGAAVDIHDVVVLRAGVLLSDNPYVEEGDGDREVGGSFGIGIRYQGFEADVAREVSVSELGDETHFAVGWRF